MTIWQRLSAATSLVFKGSGESLGNTQDPSSRLVDLFGGKATASGVAVNDSSAMRVSAVYACVRVIAEDISKLTPQIWQTQPDGSRKIFTASPLYDILESPHRLLTIVNLLMAMSAALGFRGNAILVILRDKNGRPNGLWPVHPGSVTIYEATDGTLFYVISRRSILDMAVLKDVPLMVPDYDIMHVRGLTFDGVIGLSPLAQLREDIGVALAGQQMSGALMRNGAQVGGVLKHPGKLSDQGVIDRLRASWSQRNAGPDKAGSTVILEEGMGFEKLGMTSVDAQFLEQRKLTIEEIARGFRVPLHMIGVLDKMTNNNVESLTRSYYDQTLMPLLKSIEAEFRRAFRLPRNVYVDFDVKQLLRADFITRQNGNRTQFQSGALMPNEWRIDEGRDPTPAGAVFARPLNTAYVDKDGTVVSVTPPGGNPVDPSADDPSANSDGGSGKQPATS
ncbi:MAG: phage portal protein family [Rhodospirillales bacterium]|nr:phage portal protein family [Rhodospirillales bacterium]